MLLNHFVTAVLLHSAGQCDVGRGGHFQTSFEGPTRVGPMASGGYTASTMTRTKSFGTTLVLSLKQNILFGFNRFTAVYPHEF